MFVHRVPSRDIHSGECHKVWLTGDGVDDTIYNSLTRSLRSHECMHMSRWVHACFDVHAAGSQVS